MGFWSRGSAVVWLTGRLRPESLALHKNIGRALSLSDGQQGGMAQYCSRSCRLLHLSPFFLCCIFNGRFSSLRPLFSAIAPVTRGSECSLCLSLCSSYKTSTTKPSQSQGGRRLPAPKEARGERDHQIGLSLAVFAAVASGVRAVCAGRWGQLGV